ncbi:MAG: TRAP transporter small permease subunit, partial [Rhodocyclaceae bacterium]|nr:TRAP transporter small permease subunit [Rhodocyclaceae bacterium]
REWVQQGAREANDLAQLGFGLYVAIAITYATRQRAHLATDVLAHRYRPALRRRIGRLANIFIALPWAAFVLYAAWPTLRQSVGQLEAFPDTTNPGYFLLRLAVALCALLVGLQALVDVLKREDD